MQVGNTRGKAASWEAFPHAPAWHNPVLSQWEDVTHQHLPGEVRSLLVRGAGVPGGCRHIEVVLVQPVQPPCQVSVCLFKHPHVCNLENSINRAAVVVISNLLLPPGASLGAAAAHPRCSGSLLPCQGTAWLGRRTSPSLP